MQISMIADENGGDTAILSKFPMKGVKPSLFMIASGDESIAELRVLIYK